MPEIPMEADDRQLSTDEQEEYEAYLDKLEKEIETAEFEIECKRDEEVLAKLTGCWACSKLYTFNLPECPYCLSTNANYDLLKATNELEKK